MKILLALGLFGLLFRGRRPTHTPWTNAGLPAPVAPIPTLTAHARELAGALRQPARPGTVDYRPGTIGLVKQLQREAGLLREMIETAERSPDEGRDRAAEGVYDAITRQATGYYGMLWQEETP